MDIEFPGKIPILKKNDFNLDALLKYLESDATAGLYDFNRDSKKFQLKK